MPAGPEGALPPVQHLTSTAPDHQFHSDPTPLLPQPPANAMTPTLEDLVTNSGLPLEQVLNSPEAVHAAVKVSDLALIGLDHGLLNPAGWMRDALVGIHVMSGLPWWASIMALTLGVRACLGPLVIRNMKHNQRLQAVGPQMQALIKRMREASSAGDQTAAMVTQKNLQQLLKEHDVSPFRPVLMPLIQMPFFLSIFYALRGLANAPLPQLKEGGFGWVLDLTVADPYYILPITSIALQLLVLRVGADGTAAHQQGSSQRTMGHVRNGFMALSPLMVGMVSQFPAAVLFYWTATNLFTLAQATVLRQSWARKLLGIHTPPKLDVPASEQVDPNPTFKETWEAIRQTHSDMLQKAREKDAEQRAHTAAATERARNTPVGTGLLAEKVNEPKAAPAAPASAAAAPSSPAFLEPEGADAAKAPAVTRQELKRRRIDAAREKRRQ